MCNYLCIEIKLAYIFEIVVSNKILKDRRNLIRQKLDIREPCRLEKRPKFYLGMRRYDITYKGLI